MDNAYPCLRCKELVVLTYANQHPCFKNCKTIALTSDNKLVPLLTGNINFCRYNMNKY